MNKKSPPNPYKVLVSKRFLLTTLFGCSLVAFATGRAAIWFLSTQNNNARTSATNSAGAVNLPHPVLQPGKTAPQSKYFSKTFDTSLATSSNSRWIVIDQEDTCNDTEESEESSSSPSQQQDQQQCVTTDTEASTTATETNKTDYNNADDDDDEVHLPKGQHLILDIKNVDPDFLSSEERLATTMMEVVNKCGLTLLSYHCHGLYPSSGVSCVGVLLESHVSFHTYPNSGVVLFDLFTCGPESLLPIVSTVIQRFSVAGPPSIMPEPPQPVWAYKFRGFGADNKETIGQLTDLFTFPIGFMADYKQEITSTKTSKHRVDIYDVIRPHFQDLAAYQTSFIRDTFEYRHRKTFEPDRILFLDGELVSRRSGEASFHEALIHPAMFVHSNPRRVLIIGGGYGAHVREILKHPIDKVVVVQKDAQFVEIAKEYLPEYTTCFDDAHNETTCFDDDRVEMIYQEFDDYLNNYKEEASSLKSEFDVIILDDIDFLEASYSDEEFVQFLSTALLPNGIFVAHVGDAPTTSSPSEQYSIFQYRYRLLQNLQEVGFESIRDYEEGHVGLELASLFVIGFKDFDTRNKWFQSEASMNLQMQKRITSDATFSYFDGATMQSYLYPSKFSESVYCRQIPIPVTCQGSWVQKEKTNLDFQQVDGISTGGNLKEYNIPNFYIGKNQFGDLATLQSSYIGSATAIDLTSFNNYENADTRIPTNFVLPSYDPATHRQSGFHTGTLFVPLGGDPSNDN